MRYNKTNREGGLDMIVHEYGPTTLPKVLLLPPFGFTGEQAHYYFSKYAKKEYCYVVPDFGGHGFDEKPYKDIEEETNYLIHYLEDNGFYDIKFMVSLGYGSSLAIRVLQHKRLHIHKSFIAALPLFEETLKFTFQETLHYKHVRKVFERDIQRVNNSSLEDSYGKVFGQLFAAGLSELSEENLSKIVSNMFNNMEIVLPEEVLKSVVLIYDKKDRYFKKSKKNLELLYPHAEVILHKGYGHLEYIANHLEEFVTEVESRVE